MESKPHINSNGVVFWKLPNGDFHREDGPAIDYGDDRNVIGSQCWYKYGKVHRLDGPAAIWKDGSKFWFINDHPVTNKIIKWANEMNIDLDNLTDEDKMLIRIYWENYSE